MRDKEVVLLVGATGKVGKHILSLLQKQNRYNIRLLVRDVERAKSMLGVENLEYVKGDVSELDNLGTALKGVDKVICTIGSGKIRIWFFDYFSALPPSHPSKVDYMGVVNLVKAAKDSGCKHFVLVSSLGVTRPWFPIAILLNTLLSRVLEWKLKSERFLRDSGLPYTVVRPGGLAHKSSEPSPVGVTLAQGDTKAGSIDIVDVAQLCVEALDQPNARNRTFECFCDWSARKKETSGEQWKDKFNCLSEDSGELPLVAHTPPLLIITGIVLSIFCGLLYKIVF